MPFYVFLPFLTIDINIDPTIFTAGPFTLTWHGLFTAVGIICGVSLSVYLAKKDGIPSDVGEEIALVAVPAAIVGARLFYCLEHFDTFKDDPAKIVTGITDGGITLYGGLIAGVVSGVVYALWRKWPIAIGLDAAAPGMILGQGIGRIGDLINGEHHGTASSLPWAFKYTNPNTLAELGKSVHPTAGGYELIGDFLICAILLFVCRRRFKSPGLVFCAYVVIYGVLRFFLSYFRLDEREYFGISDAQMVSAALVALALIGASILFRHPGPITKEYADRVWGDEADERMDALDKGNSKKTATA